jgi:hypothetical protein
MDPVFTFGFKLAELTKQSEAASLSLISLAIKDAGKDRKDLGYQDLRVVFQVHLSRRLEKRYKLVIAYSCIALVTPLLTVMGVASQFFPFVTTILDSLVLGFIVLGSLITFAGLEYLAWVMPQPYRHFLNRRHQPIEQSQRFSLEMAEEEVPHAFQPGNG